MKKYVQHMRSIVKFKAKPIWPLLLLAVLSVLLIVPRKSVADQFNCKYKNRLLGYRFYLLFPRVAVPDQTLEDKCLYEFYEGINQASTILETNYTKLGDICSVINKKYPVKTWDICYFKLGIASTYTQRAVVDTPGGLEKLVDDKLIFCEGMGDKKLDCVIGVYTGVNLAFQNLDKDSVFPIKDNNPFWLCGVGLGPQHKLQCFRNMVSMLFDFTGGDTDKAVKIIYDSLQDPFEKFEIALTFYSSLAYGKNTPAEAQITCAKIHDAKTRYACIEGYATGLDEVLPQGTEALGIVKYCLTPIFSYKERGECIRRGFFELPGTSSFQERNRICRLMVPNLYKRFCVVEIDVPLTEYVNSKN